MSILSQKLYIKKGSSTAACNIYSTAAEAGDKALRVGNGYVALKDVTDANATAGRVSINGVTYAIATQHTAAVSVPYTEKYWTDAGDYTFTVPSGVSRMRVAVCGGGAGKGSLTGNGKDGGNTSAFGVTATGGYGAGVAWSKGDGGTPNGHASSGNSITDGFLMSFDINKGTYGRGGQYGGSGGYDSQYVSVTAGKSYAITVGGAGGTNGTGGFALIAYGGDI